ncbi:MAG: stage 0 sporulation protein [Candidatus Schekmanbacteria bacterium]|nr:stage 0 sporulation protein [Candidatus Schekmanbacteria bacterium]
MEQEGTEIKEETPEIIRTRLIGCCKLYHFITAGIKLKKGDYCIVEVDKGQDAAIVTSDPFIPHKGTDISSFKKVIRKATDDDVKKIETHKEKEREVLRKAGDKVESRNLQMKIVRVDTSFDDSKIIFYFIADGRIDFRELVKDLAYEFRTRIEMRQIGVRDQARIIGGYGHCGRELCCSSFLEEFEPVSIKMAKAQNLTLNPNKLSGICGRLMCCLMYEYTTYKEINRDLPKYGKKVTLHDGRTGKVRKVNTITRKLIVELEDTTMVTVDADDLDVEKVALEADDSADE